MPKKKPRPTYVSLIPGKKEDEDTGPEIPDWDYWHIPARDDKGHYDIMHIKVPPALKALCQITVDSKKYPLKSIGYLYRRGLLRELKAIRELPEYEDGVGSTIHNILMMTEIVREDEYMEDFRSIFDKLDERVRDLTRRGSDDRARKLVIKMWAQIKQMNDDYWRTEFEKELRQRYGRMLQGEDGKG
jgi:hypothetical protein